MSKQYFHRFAGAKFFMPNGQEICFAGGEFNTATVKDPVLRAQAEAELDKIANVPASMVYTKEVVADISERGVATELMDTATTGFDSVNKINSSQAKTVELPQGPQNKPQVPGSGHQKTQTVPVSKPVEDPLVKARAAIAAASNSAPSK